MGSPFPRRTALFLLILFPLLNSQVGNSPCHALDEGGATIAFEHRTLNRETAFGDSHQDESLYHLDLRQEVPNAGRIALWLDWISAQNPDPVNRLGQGTLSWRGFRYNDFLLDGFLGDHAIRFTNLPVRFANSVYNDVYFRGWEGDFSSQWGEAQIFGGRVSRIEGILGRTYTPTDESLYGFRSSFRLHPRLQIGAGLIRTGDEVDITGLPVSQRNNIYLIDSAWIVSPGVTWLTELRGSDREGARGENQRDFALKIGPLLNFPKIRLEANYRRIGTDYHFVSQATQLESDQEGFFSLAEYKPLLALALFGNLDFYRDNVSGKPELNTNDIRRGLLGGSFYHPRYPSLYATFDVTERRSRSRSPSPADNLAVTLQAEVRYPLGNSIPYLRYRWARNDDRIDRANENLQNVLTPGFRLALGQASAIYVEGEIDRREFRAGETDQRLSGKVGFYYSPYPDLAWWGEIIYSRLQDRREDTRRGQIEATTGLTLQLPWGFFFSGDFHYDSILDPPREDLKSQGILFTIRAGRKFHWGKKEKIAGLRMGLEEKGHGTVEGVVFNDRNRNGIQDEGEEGIGEVIIRLEDGSTVKTSGKGLYQFPRVEVGSHSVIVDVKRIPAEYTIISPETQKIEVRLREKVGVNFQLLAAGRIEGRVINDLDGNGKVDPDEKGLPDVLVLLQPGDNNTYTGEDGRFVFENVLPGEYVLKVDLATLPEDAVLTSAEELQALLSIGGELKEMNFLIHIKPRPILIGPPRK